jgi:hypothetical protein
MFVNPKLNKILGPKIIRAKNGIQIRGNSWMKERRKKRMKKERGLPV